MNLAVQAPGKELKSEEKKLFARVRQTLWDYEPLRASHADIVIGIRGRSVRLSGRVRTATHKVLAEVLVRRLEGVDEVSNALVSDPEVVRDVADALAADPRTAPYVIRVDSRHGAVTLQGEVPDAATAQAAVDVASRVPRVALVRNQLTPGGPTYPPVALGAPAPGAHATDAPALEGVGTLSG
jgi:osmotically-inducible protein OsmY